eukprot:TRINITY_DN2555_c0_g1_i1.p1 TRINITY_DN2555_c0_g1~~TRINITY_DN2555_c0_g1_i1.p1  ORF type:complete len:316 (+),score=153.96 TRINITY_DN2555_c0_g1_i1:88-1035(+)
MQWIAEKLRSSPVVLNNAGEDAAADADAAAVATALNRRVLGLYGEFLSDDGNAVDYRGMADSDMFAEFCEAVGSLRTLDATTLDVPARTAFFVNLYNMLEIHARIEAKRVGGSAGAQHKYKLRAAYDVGGHVLTLSDIEHGVLRANRRPPYSPVTRFGSGDKRLALSLSECDPRLHFALVCGAKGCPPVRIFNAKNLDRALDTAAVWFCNDSGNVRVDELSMRVHLSHIFRWYSGDFGTRTLDAKNLPTLRFIHARLKDTTDAEKQTKAALGAMIESGLVTVEWIPYDWTVNEKPQSDDINTAADEPPIAQIGPE